MKDLIFFDSEFTGLHKNTTLISLGITTFDGRTFEAEFTDYDKEQVDDWVRDNVIKNLTIPKTDKSKGEREYYWASRHKSNSIYNDIYDGYSVRLRGNKTEIKEELERWLKQFKNGVEVWSDCLSYDWILFNDIFEHAFNLPDNVYYIPFDICTLFKIKGIDPDISREEFIGDSVKGKKHNALYDAEVIKECYKKLISL